MQPILGIKVRVYVKYTMRIKQSSSVMLEKVMTPKPAFSDLSFSFAGTLTQKITELSNYFCTTCHSTDSICQQIFCEFI